MPQENENSWKLFGTTEWTVSQIPTLTPTTASTALRKVFELCGFCRGVWYKTQIEHRKLCSKNTVCYPIVYVRVMFVLFVSECLFINDEMNVFLLFRTLIKKSQWKTNEKNKIVQHFTLQRNKFYALFIRIAVLAVWPRYLWSFVVDELTKWWNSIMWIEIEFWGELSNDKRFVNFLFSALCLDVKTKRKR